MTNKEIEQKIQESVDNIEMRSFDEIWQEISPQITAEQKKRNVKWKRWMPIAASFLGVLLVGAAALPFILPNLQNGGGDSSSSEEMRYLDSELERTAVEKTEYFMLIEQSNMSVVDLSSFEFLSSFVYHTTNKETKGALIEAYKEQAGIVHYFMLKFYDSSVECSEPNFSNFDLSYTTKIGLTIDYKYSEKYGAYYIQTEYKNVDYYMQYTLGGGEITEFFEEFFQ